MDNQPWMKLAFQNSTPWLEDCGSGEVIAAVKMDAESLPLPAKRAVGRGTMWYEKGCIHLPPAAECPPGQTWGRRGGFHDCKVQIRRTDDWNISGKGSSGPVRIRTFFQPEFYQQAIAQRCEADDRIAPPKRQALTQD